ncbi:TonB family C-terminal domain-containing protein [Sphingomonas palmae]|uniref:TonB family C-terminal domain-containing protein n=1 Tax=Sphingomonas palmae TaxID=1855283 RepID=A0A1H7M1M3_9SPHN|nr:energy transducer TonB [Sphingomonas palmae]SEL05133.1 TonB family C-terminal domain-containing protein [Sphingomonas palmae]
MGSLMLVALAGAAVTYSGPTPIGDPLTWISWADYPSAALNAAKEGRTEIEISVDPTGHAARCRTVTSSGVTILDQMACAAFARRGKWEPTLDMAGKPIFAIYRQRVSWRLGNGQREAAITPPDMEVEVAKLPVPAADAKVVVRQIQRSDGSQETCDVVKPSPSAALNRAAYTVGAQLTATEPIGDAAGQLVRGARWRTIEFVEKGATPPSK